MTSPLLSPLSPFGRPASLSARRSLQLPLSHLIILVISLGPTEASELVVSWHQPIEVLQPRLHRSRHTAPRPDLA